MSEEFNHGCIMIEKEYAKNSILCIEQIFPILTAIEFSNLDILIISTKNSNDANKEIIPSLSIYKAKQSISNSATNFSELWRFISECSGVPIDTNTNKLLNGLLAYATRANFLISEFNEFRVAILIKAYSNNFVDRRHLNRLARAVYYTRQKSQNLINDSNHLADRNRNELEKLLTPDLDSAVDTITKFIKEKYGVEAYALQYIDNQKRWSCKQTCPINAARIVNTYIERVSDQVKPVAGIFADRYFVIFPFISTLVRRDLQSLILIQSEHAIPSYLVANLRYFTNYYFAVYLEERKSDLLELLQLKTLDLYHEVERIIDSGKQINICQQLRSFVKPAFEIALSATNAFSASLRLYDPESDSLEIVYRIGSGRVEEAPTADETGIPIKDFSKSQVAFVFRYSKPGDDGKYIPDIQNIKKKAIPAYREHRSNTRSELCFCIYFKKTPVGVLNFESAQFGGFLHDKRFLKKIRTSLENYLTALFESNDKQWLARRSRIYQNLHEIKHLINSNFFPREFTAEIGRYIEVNEVVDRSIDPVKLVALEKFRDEYIDSYKKEIERTVPIRSIGNEMVKEFSFGCKVRIIDSEKKIQQYKMNLLKIMYKNLLDNYRKWGDIERDSVLIHQRKNTGFIEFIVKSSTLFNDTNMKKLLIEPYTTTADSENKAHYGMFIVGMIARHLCGYAYVTNKKEMSISLLMIKIPIS